jgi:hypothetical protein
MSLRLRTKGPSSVTRAVSRLIASCCCASSVSSRRHLAGSTVKAARAGRFRYPRPPQPFSVKPVSSCQIVHRKPHDREQNTQNARSRRTSVTGYGWRPMTDQLEPQR